MDGIGPWRARGGRRRTCSTKTRACADSTRGGGEDGAIILEAGGLTVTARPDGRGGWNLPAEDPDDPDAHAAGDGDLLDLAALRTGAMPRGLPLSD